HRRPREGALHLSPPGDVHRRRHRGDGRDGQRHAPAAHAPAVRLRRGAAPDEALLPRQEVPEDPRPGARAHPGGRHHHRHHRRLPGRDRAGLPAHPGRGRGSRFSSAFTFQYSIRPGTPAASMDDQIPKEVVQERYERLTALQDRITHEENQKLENTVVEVLVAEGEGERDAQTRRISGRARDHRLVHLSLPAELPAAQRPRPGDLVTTTITRAAPHYLISDSALAAP